MLDPVALLPLFLVGAFLYSSVGHGGATVYLAILVLSGYSASQVAVPVLILNVVVAGFAFALFRQAGHLRPRLLLPFVVASVPAAFLGGFVPLSNASASLVLAIALLLGATRLLVVPQLPHPRLRLDGGRFWLLAIPLGAGLGFLAGATGIGGGIFLSPILLFLGLATVKEAGAVASAFIVLNSLAGLAARVPGQAVDWGLVAPLLATVAVGGGLGAFLGSTRFSLPRVQRLLGGVLLVAAVRAFLAVIGDFG